MVVRQKMSQSKFAKEKVQGTAWIVRPIPIDGGQVETDLLREKIQSGRAFLKVSAYPWGVEFDVCEEEGAP
jgi:hypothetical protein